MDGYRKCLRLALVVPVRAAGDEDEAALLLRHRFNVAQACALGDRGAEAALFVDAPFSRVRPIGERAAIHFVAAPPMLRAGLAPGAHLLAAALASLPRPDAIHLFHVLDVKTLALAAAFARARLFAEYNG